jgi:multidrug efflux pump subunit AcrA (membrane-fusion protein)
MTRAARRVPDMRTFSAVVALSSILLLTGCGSFGASPTPLPTVVISRDGAAASTPALDSGFTAGIQATGRVVSPQEAALAFAQGGTVTSVNVVVGDRVRAGDLLLTLDDTQAQEEVNRAQRSLREMTSPAAIAAADQAVAEAQQEQDKAQKKAVSLNYPRATDEFIDNLRAQITLARKELADATKDFNHYEDRADNDPKKARAQVRMTSAQINLNKLLGNYNWYTGQPSEIDVALIHANLEAATAAVQEAQWYASALRGDPIPDDASGPDLSALQEARDALAAAQANLDATRITSPIDGIVGAVTLARGEYATPGETAAIVTDPDHLQVETTDLSELDLPRLAIGQPASISVEALQALAAGHVTAISPVAQTLGGDVVYTVIVALDEIPEGLRPGMTVKVSFGESP